MTKNKAMCGIFGYVGHKTDAADIVLEGLKLLEYRGYDSWGVATKIKNHPFGKLRTKIKNSFLIEKHVGKIGNAKLNSEFSTLNSGLAIGHTRWATHGGVTAANAHPHLDCTRKIAVVHNGIVENFQELKTDLLKKGHKFISETDTEVIAHLVEDDLKHEGFATSVKDAFNRLKGLSAIVIAYAPSREIVAAKTGSPLVVGIGENELFVASDASAIVKHTKKVIFLEDNQMVILGAKFKLIKLPSGEEIKPNFNMLDWKFEEALRGNYKHFFLKEIYEQPKILQSIVLNSLGQIKELSKLIDKAFGTFLIACGSASYAALVATYLFSSIAKKHVNFAVGSEFKYLEDFITNKTLVIPISQSGESVDVIEPVTRAKEKGAKIAAIVNVLGSTLFREADFKVLLNAGVEKAVVATKSFTAMVAVVIMTAYTLSGKEKEGKELIINAAKNVSEILKEDYVLEIKKVANFLENKEHVYIIGRGLSYATALEATLKLKESTYIHAEGFAGGELKHGVIALIEKGTPCIVFAPQDETYSEIISNAQEIKARGGVIIGVGPNNNQVFDYYLQTGDLRHATMIPQVVISQLLAYHLALKRGIKDPDKPRNLAKSVTVK